MIVVVDTNVVSYIFKNDTRANHYKRLLVQKLPMISFQTWAELYRWGLQNRWGLQKQHELAEMLSHFISIPHTYKTSIHWAKIMSEAKDKGIALTVSDAWIAATALELNVPLLTHNVKDFQAISGLKVLSI